MPLGKKVGLDPGDIVLDGDPALPPKKGAQPPTVSPNFRMLWPNGWIKIPVGTEVGLGLGDIAWDPAPSWKGAQQPPLFCPCLLWPNGRPS